MKYKKFHKLIEEEYAEQKQSAYEGLKEELNLPDDPVPAKRTHARDFFKNPYRLISCLAAAIVSISLAIVLPVTLNKEEPHYSSTDNWILTVNMEDTIKEYAQKNNLPYLYIDWYDSADHVSTKLNTNRNTGEMLWISEELSDSSKGEVVNLYIGDKYNQTKIFDVFYDPMMRETLIKGIKVFWVNNGANNQRAYFDYGGYRYFIELTSYLPSIEPSIFDIIEAMLP